ncbi:MAG: hypothetical protein FWE97_03335 [Dehalococcoidia bacterium]|nr:hypothetical protein [Dehalococcoidia bacterium]
MEEIIVRLSADLPHEVRAITVTDANGDYNVYVNSRLAYYDRMVAHDHEIAHIENGHFSMPEMSIFQVESEVV